MEHTITDILALPLSRSAIVTAKFLIVFLWTFALSLILFISALLMGILIDIPGWEADLIFDFAYSYITTALFTILLSTVIGFVASYTRGIIAPIGFVLLMVIMAQFIALLGWGPYFPWAIPGVFTVSKSVEDMQLVPMSYFILFSTFLLGLYSTYAYWKWADQ